MGRISRRKKDGWPGFLPESERRQAAAAQGNETETEMELQPVSETETEPELVNTSDQGIETELETALEAGCAVGTLRATGGSASSAVWMDIKANVTGCEMVAAQGELAAVRGAALIAGVGVGAVSGWNAWKTENGQEKRYLPADGLREVYEAGFERYLALSGAMQPLYKRGI